LENANLPKYTRQDTKISDAKERPTSKQYDEYVYLLELGKRHQYDGKGIAEESEFLIQDSLINAVLIRSNEALINIGKRFNFDTKELEEWQTQSIKQYNAKLWSDKLNTYTGYDLRQAKQFPQWEIGGLTALFANIPTPERAEKMSNYLADLMANNYFIVPSFDVHHELYDSKRYWRGPIWPQMNWMIYHGLKQYNFQTEADFVRESLLSLVERFGFHEYFEAQRHLVNTTHGGYGGDNFSWTASSVIDLLLCP
ncbi:MAG: MGH1-like glycoside hydrolase domain-containing protein, partial [Saprospiraceae bacterium]